MSTTNYTQKDVDDARIAANQAATFYSSIQFNVNVPKADRDAALKARNDTRMDYDLKRRAFFQQNAMAAAASGSGVLSSAAAAGGRPPPPIVNPGPNVPVIPGSVAAQQAAAALADRVSLADLGGRGKKKSVKFMHCKF